MTELDQYKKLFAALDSNNDGKLSREELEMGALALGVQIQPSFPKKQFYQFTDLVGACKHSDAEFRQTVEQALGAMADENSNICAVAAKSFVLQFGVFLTELEADLLVTKAVIQDGKVKSEALVQVLFS